MQELFGEKPWMQPLAVAGSHLNETESESDVQEKENLPEKGNVCLMIDVKLISVFDLLTQPEPC